MASDWQINFDYIKERGKYILENNKFSDCQFLVGPEENKIEAHKLILAMASPVFEKMFYGSLSEEHPIVIPDVKPDVFQNMLEYIYSDNLNIQSSDKAFELWHMAHKYILPKAIKKCTEFLKHKLSATNVFRAYELAKFFDDSNFLQNAMNFIKSNTSAILGDSSFLYIDVSTLMDILNQESLGISSELELFQALERYAIKRGLLKTEEDENIKSCTEKKRKLEAQNELKSKKFKNNESDVTETVKKSENFPLEQKVIMDENMLTDALHKIRFLTMTAEEFAEGPSCSKLLQTHESLPILQIILSKKKDYTKMPPGFSKSCNYRFYKPYDRYYGHYYDSSDS